MNLAFTAAPLDPFDTNENHNIGQKRKIMQQQQQSSQNNKTRKQIHNSSSETFIDNDKVNSVLASIHKGYADAEDDDEDTYSKPLSASSEKPSNKNKVAKIEKMTNQSDVFGDGSVPLPLEKNYIDLQKLENNYMNDEEVEKYYKNILPNYEYKDVKNTKKYSQNTQSKNYFDDPTINKLNYIIDLLEESKDQRTNNTTEELVLYSFLGVFIIFIVDGFTRVGKYVR